MDRVNVHMSVGVLERLSKWKSRSLATGLG